MPIGEPREELLRDTMPARQPVWERIVETHGPANPSMADARLIPFS